MPADEVAKMLREMDDDKGRRVLLATLRDGDSGEVHVECRFDSGEKYAPIVVDDDDEDVARWFVRSVALRNALPALADLLDAANAVRRDHGACDVREGTADNCRTFDAARARVLAALKGEGE